MVVDNVGVVRLSNEGPLSGSRLRVGTHNVTYIALDGEGNIAECDITIEVLQQGESNSIKAAINICQREFPRGKYVLIAQ